MEQSKIETFVAAKQSQLTAEDLATVKQKMASLPDDKCATLMAVEMRNPIVIWVISFFLGFLGIDRFLVGCVGAGVGKLLTGGAFGIWWLIDLFLIGKKARQYNFSKLLPFLG